MTTLSNNTPNGEKWLWLILAAAVLACAMLLGSCNPEKQLIHILKEHPEYLKKFDKEVQIDTNLIVQGHLIHTGFLLVPGDTFNSIQVLIDSLSHGFQVIYKDSDITVEQKYNPDTRTIQTKGVKNPKKIFYTDTIQYFDTVHFKETLKVPCNCPELPEHKYKWWEIIPWSIGLLAIVVAILWFPRAKH